MTYQFKVLPQKVKKISTKYRCIQTKIPCPGTSKVLNSLKNNESRSMHGQIPLVWESAKNFTITDKSGNKWIDFTSGIFFANIGHGNPYLVKSLKNSLSRPLLGSYSYGNEVRERYFRELISFAGTNFEKAFLLSSGTESTEAALKLMRMNGRKISNKKIGIISLQNNWHGRTMGSQLMSGNEGQKEWIGYKDKTIHHLPFPYPWHLKNISGKEFALKIINELIKSGVNPKKEICGFILETFQGWGAIFYPEDFVVEIKKFCKENNILLTFDEMQSGFARTGKAFGYEHYNVEADLLCIGKGMGGGYPISGVIGKECVMDLPEVGNMSSTHSANPLGCSAGLAVLREIKRKNLIKETERKGFILNKFLSSLKKENPEKISYTFGKGLISSIIFHKNNMPDINLASKVSELCMQKGLLVVHTGRESIKIGPPLTITDQALIEGLSVLEETIKELY